MFIISSELVKENDKLRKFNSYLKEYLGSLEERKKSVNLEITKIRNSSKFCETHVSLKKKVDDLHETLSKFTQGIENLDLVLSSQIPSLNQNGIGLKKNRKPNRGIYHKKNNHLLYKCTRWKRISHLKTFYFDKLKSYVAMGNKYLWVD